MKKLREMKKNNKGFSLVELIVVIAIMVVLIAVLGSTILGYVEKSKYSKDISALDSVDTAVKAYAVDPSAKFAGGATTLEELMKDANDPYNIIENALKETFSAKTESGKTTYTFNSSSKAFNKLTAADIKVTIADGTVSIYVPVVSSEADDFAPYRSGKAYESEKATRADVK